MHWIVAVGIAVLVIGAAMTQDYAFLSLPYWQEGGLTTSRSEVVRNLGLLAAAVVGLGFGIWRAVTAYIQAEASRNQARVAEQGHFTERFSRAVEHLGSEQLPVRLGGIYALWRLGEDSPKRDLLRVIDILCAFVRDPPHVPGEQFEEVPPEMAGTETEQEPRLRTDVQTVVDLLGAKDATHRPNLPQGYRLDLRHADLSRGSLTSLNLKGAVLLGAKLSSTQGFGADLSNTTLILAKLERAALFKANLAHANLSAANCIGAMFHNAILESANLSYANLVNCVLAGANLTGADFLNANLEGAELANANLSKANLTHVNLAGAELAGANLLDADITSAVLIGASNLTQKQLDSARSLPQFPPELPDGLTPPRSRTEGTADK